MILFLKKETALKLFRTTTWGPANAVFKTQCAKLIITDPQLSTLPPWFTNSQNISKLQQVQRHSTSYVTGNWGHIHHSLWMGRQWSSIVNTVVKTCSTESSTTWSKLIFLWRLTCHRPIPEAMPLISCSSIAVVLDASIHSFFMLPGSMNETPYCTVPYFTT